MLDTNEPAAMRLAERLGALNAELNGQSMGAVLQVLQQANLSMPRLVALFHLHKHGCATISELSERLNLALGTTSQAIDQLVHAGLVERREDVHDRRHKRVTLTPAGQAIVNHVRQLRQNETARRFTELPSPLVVRLEAIISEVIDALQVEQPATRA